MFRNMPILVILYIDDFILVSVSVKSRHIMLDFPWYRLYIVQGSPECDPQILIDWLHQVPEDPCLRVPNHRS